MHKLTPLALLFAAAASHADVGLYAGKGTGKLVKSYSTYSECIAGGKATFGGKKQYSCNTIVTPPAPAPEGRKFRLGASEFGGSTGISCQMDRVRLIEYVGPGPDWAV